MTTVGLTFLDTRLEVPMHPQDVLRDGPVPLFVGIVGDDKQQIETGQQRIRQGNVPMRILVHVVLQDISLLAHKALHKGQSL